MENFEDLSEEVRTRSSEYPDFQYDGSFNEKPFLGNDDDLSVGVDEDEREIVEVGFDINSWKYAILTPEMRETIVRDGIKLTSRWADFWAILNPMEGLDSPEIVSALDTTKPVKGYWAKS